MLSHKKAAAASGRGAHDDYRKLQAMMDDLRMLKNELDPASKDAPPTAQELSSLDAFSRAKHALSLSLHSLRLEIERLAAMRARLGEGRDIDSIRLTHEVHEQLNDAGQQFKALRVLHTKSEKQAQQKRSALTPRVIADRRDMLRLIGLELVSLTQAASASSASHVVESQEDQIIIDRVAARRQAAQEARQAARDARRGARSGGGRNAGARGRPLGADEFVIHIDGLQEVDLSAQAAPSEQEAAFISQVDANRQTQDRLLDELLRGLADLEQLARQAEVQLGVQAVALGQVDGAMDKNIAGFKSANKQLRSILQSTGGLTRWVPLMVCAVILIALLGFIFGILK